MADNPNVNKVVYGNDTIMDITDTTAEASDVAAGEVFYTKSGARSVGTGNYMDKAANPTADDILVTDANGQAVDSGVGIADVAMASDLPGQATDTTLGLVKLNPNQSIDVNNDGQLTVGGRLGQYPTTTGIYAPNNREPRMVADYSMLVTDALGIDMQANRSMAIVSGFSITVQSAAPGSTVYYAANNYINRIIAKVCENGYISKDEATSKEETIIPVVSVLIDGATFYPDSAANDSSKPIVITLEETANPDTTITQLRMFGTMQSYASLHVGNGIRSGSSGRSLMLGGGIVKYDGNDQCMVGQNMFATGNGNAMFGRQHIARKNRGFFAGTGHDGTNAKSEGVAAFGQWSNIASTTAFAYGNGTSHTARSNSLELLNDGRLKISGTPSEADDVVTKGYADANYGGGGGGGPTVTTYGNADFTYQQVIDPETGTVTNECVPYSTVAGNANEPTAVKYGRIVNLAGAFKNVGLRASNAAFDMGSVPAGCEPLKTQYILSQGSTQHKFMLTIRPDGSMSCARYSTGASAIAVTDGAWLNINATYVSAT